MFTGIIKRVSKVFKVCKEKGNLFVEIEIPSGWKIKTGESISVNGVCSTVKNVGEKSFTVEYMPETMKKATVGDFKKGTEVNLERSLRVGDLMDGHIVQGHVDCVGKITEIKRVKQSKVIKIKAPKAFMKFFPSKGSVSVDGISLTIVDSKKDWFTVSLVSYTLENTNLGKIRVRGKVNIEVDIIAKYLEKLLKNHNN
ncbi:MAG: riboflavin synthase [Candidatus Moranbacteria bacterium CG_4_10_14_3_um_filter_44_15]|nr:MAG: riboflavin synthase [Candidatus Moranbacteria bacterium CG17_big_fil_post_rev_8_21_14_2_50_44_12]PIX91036.1 MAG: riboflavin synthase [Candidatus Moranbacteria bacterium CG_4_10_14_3_um_filter_44_15]PJA86097.1 MAG: riboflavin synthase [Candidatus Moranbacteria bacterium CG_4_9_14_3_um_filter_44_28]